MRSHYSSCMKDNLTPEKRFDKNGRLVTKHVRAGVPTHKKPLSIPKVFAVKSEMGVFGKGSETESQRVTDMLARMDPDHLYALRDIMKDSDEQTRSQLQMLISNRSYANHDAEYPAPLDPSLQYAALLLPLLNQLHSSSGGFTAGNVEIIKDGIQRDLGDKAPDSILFGTEEEQALVKGHCILTQEGFYRTSAPESYWDDAEWLGRHADELAPHFERIFTFPDFDREFCESLLNTEAPSLSSGLL